MHHHTLSSLRILLVLGTLASLLAAAVDPLPAKAACLPAPTAGDDVITCDGEADTLNALGGNDYVSGGGGNDRLTGGDGNDTLDGGAGTDQLNGNNGNDMLTGGAGNDTLTGHAGDDSLTGGSGNDTYNFDTDSPLGTDTVSEAAGGGTDTLQFAGSNNAINLDLSLAGAQVVNANLGLNLTAAQVERATGGNVGDTIAGNALANLLRGGNGNDTISGAAGNDTLYGDAGNDTLAGNDGNDTQFGGAGNDVLIADAGNDILRGEANDDTYRFDADTALGTDSLIETTGVDTLDFASTSAGVAVNLGLTGNQVVNGNLTMNLASAIAFENLVGGGGNDTLTGNTAANQLTGGNGNDSLLGGAGNDILDGGDGDDILNGGAGSDSLAGGLGQDSLDGGDGDDTLSGDVGDDSLNGGAGHDTLSGGDDGDFLDGGDGDDFLYGGDGADTLTSAAGVDSLNGEDGDDTFVLTGVHELGDTASGGAGRNVFAFQLGTNGFLSLISGDDDVLDFSLFGVPVTIDLSASAQQNVGGGLFLTLTGLFRQVIGTMFNDRLTGNDADNAIYGGGGEDLLSGGAGADLLSGETGNDRIDGGPDVDLLDGGAGTDTVLDYESQDTHISMELGFPEPETPAGPPSVLYRVQSGDLVLLSCTGPKNILRLPNGDQASFWNLCRHRARLTVAEPSDPALALPSGHLSAMVVDVFFGETALTVLPAGSALAVSFVIPNGVEPEELGVQYWDAEAELWRHLVWAEEAGYQSVRLNPDDPADARMILGGVSVVQGERLVVVVNFPGTFALVAR